MNFTTDQQLAIDEKDQNIIVSAGAGSGKTAVLSERTIRILKEGTHINELLILSFTKVAAAEMKERIRKKIKKAIPEFPNLAQELELVDQSYITTFDSFALSVVKKYHYLLNIPRSIEITDASIINMHKTRIMNETFDEFYQNPTVEFDKLISDFCVKDTKNLKKYLLKIANKINSMTNKMSYLDTYLDNYFSESFINKTIEEYKELLLNNIKNIQKQAYKFSLLMDGTYNEKLDESLLGLYNSKTIDEIYIHCNPTLPKLPNNSEDEIKSSQQDLKKSIKKLKDTASLYGNEEEIRKSLNNTKDYVTIIIDIIKRFITKLDEYKRENQIYDFEDIALLSIKIVRENENVRKELSSSFKEIMVDEYQDTNDIQETFISMIENNNVYMVGDIKQSIYRFRNANPYIFKTKYDSYANHINGTKIDLLKNFRSRKEVLTNINEIFNLVMDNIIGGAEYHESHQMIPGNESYNEKGKTNQNYNVRILEYEEPDEKYSKEEVEIFTIAKDIKDKINNKYQVFSDNELRDITYKDFVILIDRSTSFDLYKKIFEYLGIPIAILKDETLNDSDEIHILKNIIDYIIKISNNEYDQEFKYDYISIARSYLYRLRDEEIFLSFKNDDFKNNSIYNDLSPLSNNLSATTIRSLLEQIIEKTKMYERIITTGNVESFMIRISNLLDIADNLSNIGFDIYTFKDYLTNVLESEEKMKYKVVNNADNAVKIMTIHGSKGKEYPICYFSGLYKEFNLSDLKDQFLYGEKYGIITPIFNEGIQNTILKHLYKEYYKQEEISEEIRLFYVALTRAKEQMIMVLPSYESKPNDLDDNNTIDWNVRSKYNSLADIMNSIKYKIENYYETINLDELNLTKDYLSNKNLTKLSSNKDKIEVNPITINQTSIVEEKHFSKTVHELITKEKYNNMQFGLEMHETLENIDFINPEYDLIESNFIKEKIKLFLSNDLLTNIKEANIFKEYEFIYNTDNTEYHGIIDLLLEYQDHIDIIDYKLNNIKDENYLLQLNGYKEYISKISNKPINIYLYSILSNKFEQL